MKLIFDSLDALLTETCHLRLGSRPHELGANDARRVGSSKNHHGLARRQKYRVVAPAREKSHARIGLAGIRLELERELAVCDQHRGRASSALDISLRRGTRQTSQQTERCQNKQGMSAHMSSCFRDAPENGPRAYSSSTTDDCLPRRHFRKSVASP